MTDQKSPPKDARIWDWAQHFNEQFGTLLRLVGLLGFIVFAALNRLPVASAFFGLIPISYTVGKPAEKAGGKE